ncbi:hypothetical protein ACLOJK_011438 [Asimina triloba]
MSGREGRSLLDSLSLPLSLPFSGFSALDSPRKCRKTHESASDLSETRKAPLDSSSLHTDLQLRHSSSISIPLVSELNLDADGDRIAGASAKIGDSLGLGSVSSGRCGVNESILVMDAELVGDMAALDPDLLQLPEVSPSALKLNPCIADQLFSQWLLLPDTGRLVKNLLDDAKSGVPFGGGNSSNAATGNALPSMFSAGGTPPLSPRSSSGSPRIVKRGAAGPSNLGSPLKLASEPVREVIPQFPIKNGRPPPNELKEQCISRINQFFFGHPDGLQVQGGLVTFSSPFLLSEFKLITREVCKLPSFFSTSLFRRIDVGCTGMITKYAHVIRAKLFLENTAMLYVLHWLFGICEDLKPVLRELLATHPGLEFLQSTPEFQERYALFPIVQIYIAKIAGQ